MRFQGLMEDLPKRGVRFEVIGAAVLAALCIYGAHLPRPPLKEHLLDRWRVKIVARIEDVFDPPVSAWVAGLLLGADQGFSQKWKETFRRTGTSHLTAVSGYNVGLVLAAVQAPLLRLPFRKSLRLATAAGAIAMFVLLTGAPGSVLRAAAMIAAVETGRFLGRPVRPLRALLLAALLISACSPRSLVADRGFQLSCLAAFGLATLTPIFQASFPRRLPRAIAEWISQTFSASLATAPLIAWMSGAYSLVALPANVAVAAFIPILMAAGAFILAVSLVSFPLAAFIALLARGLFFMPLALLRVMSGWRTASLSGAAGLALLVLVEAAALVLLFHCRRRASLRYLLEG